MCTRSVDHAHTLFTLWRFIIDVYRMRTTAKVDKNAYGVLCNVTHFLLCVCVLPSTFTCVWIFLARITKHTHEFHIVDLEITFASHTMYPFFVCKE